MRIRRVQKEDAEVLSKIAIEAKSHWGYPQEWIEKWRDGLTIKEEYIEANELFCLEEKEEILGWFALEFVPDSEHGILEHLWVQPSKIGKGIGKILMDKIIELSIEYGFKELKVTSDPNATGFYEKYGFELFDKIESQPKGRFLPVLKRKIKQ